MFVGLSFPRAPVTLFIIIRYLESPATTFGLVNHIRLAAIYTTIVKILVPHLLLRYMIDTSVQQIFYFLIFVFRNCPLICHNTKWNWVSSRSN